MRVVPACVEANALYRKALQKGTRRVPAGGGGIAVAAPPARSSESHDRLSTFVRLDAMRTRVHALGTRRQNTVEPPVLDGRIDAMLQPIVTRMLNHGRGRISIQAGGDIFIEQGRPHGVMANPGEAFLAPSDFALINEMYQEYFARGHRIDDPGTARPA